MVIQTPEKIGRCHRLIVAVHAPGSDIALFISLKCRVGKTRLVAALSRESIWRSSGRLRGTRLKRPLRHNELIKPSHWVIHDRSSKCDCLDRQSFDAAKGCTGSAGRGAVDGVGQLRILELPSACG